MKSSLDKIMEYGTDADDDQADSGENQWVQWAVQVELEVEHEKPQEDDSTSYSENHDLKEQEQDPFLKDQCPNIQRV